MGKVKSEGRVRFVFEGCKRRLIGRRILKDLFWRRRLVNGGRIEP